MNKTSGWIDGIALWILVLGIWPLADPGHDAGSLLSMLDIMLHTAAALLLLSRWKLTRRETLR